MLHFLLLLPFAFQQDLDVVLTLLRSVVRVDVALHDLLVLLAGAHVVLNLNLQFFVHLLFLVLPPLLVRLEVLLVLLNLEKVVLLEPLFRVVFKFYLVLVSLHCCLKGCALHGVVVLHHFFIVLRRDVVRVE